jgi:hypothetical protein
VTDSALPMKDDQAQLEEMIRAMGLVLNNASVYGQSHKVTQRAMTQAYAATKRVVETADQALLGLVEGKLVANGAEIGLRNSLCRSLYQSLSGLGIDSLLISRKVDEPQFGRLFFVLAQPPGALHEAGGIATVLASEGVTDIQLTRVSYQQVAEGEVVTAKGEEALGELSPERLDETRRFLAGDGQETTDEDVGETLYSLSLADDVQQLSELILEAAKRLQEKTPESDESLLRLVLKCLRRAVETMTRGPASQTQKGRRELRKTLETLEAQLRQNLDEAGCLQDAESQHMLAEEFEELTDELQIDALAVSYMKKRKAIEASESRILRFIQNKGLDRIAETDLCERLTDGGLTKAGWHDLLIRSGAVKEDDLPAGQGEAGVAAVTRLNTLVANLMGFVEAGQVFAGDETLEGLTDILERIQLEVGSLVERTRRKIQDLIEGLVRGAAPAPSADETRSGQEKEAFMSRRELLRLIAEIAQELCQPLSVVHCTTEMLSTGKFGAVQPQQKEILELALSSVTRLQQLIYKLMEIADVPEELIPDPDALAALYQRNFRQ